MGHDGMACAMGGSACAGTIVHDAPLAFFGSSMGAGEILLILGVVLLLFGAERLPAMARSLGKAMEEFRRAARDLTHDLTDSQQPPSKPGAPPHSEPPSDERKG